MLPTGLARRRPVFGEEVLRVRCVTTIASPSYLVYAVAFDTSNLVYFLSTAGRKQGPYETDTLRAPASFSLCIQWRREDTVTLKTSGGTPRASVSPTTSGAHLGHKEISSLEHLDKNGLSSSENI